MTKVLVVYHSFTGKTKSVAEATAEGARSAGAEVQVLKAAEASVEDVAGSEVLVLATPQTFGTLAGETKKFLERLWLGKDELPEGIGFAGIVCHADVPAATQELFSALPGFVGLTALHDPLVVPVQEIEAGCDKARELGAAVGAQR